MHDKAALNAETKPLLRGKEGQHEAAASLAAAVKSSLPSALLNELIRGSSFSCWVMGCLLQVKAEPQVYGPAVSPEEPQDL